MLRPFLRALVLALGLITLPARAQTPAPSPGLPPLTLEECIARAMQKNFDLTIQAFSTANAKEAVAVAKATLEPVLSVTTRRNVNQAASTTSRLDGTSNVGPRDDTTATTVGVSERIGTGATVGLNSNLNRRATNSSNALLNPSFNSTASVTVSQPLLKDAGPAATYATIERSKLGLSIAVLDYENRVLQVIRDTEAAYLNLVSARETLLVRQFSLELAQTLYDENLRRKATGVATDLDVLSAEVGVANARRAVMQAEQLVHDREDALLSLIGQRDFDSRPGRVSFNDVSLGALSFDYSYKLARDNYPEYLALVQAIKQARIDVRTTKRSALPELDLDGSLGYNATDRSYSSVLGDLPQREGYNWSLALTLRVPWGLHGDRARYRSSLNTLHQQETRLERLDQALLLNVRNAVRAVETNLASVEVTTKARELSARQYDLQKARFNAGLATSRLVLEAQDDLEAARLNELTAKVSLRLAIAELQRLEGSSLRRYNIALP